MSFQSVVPTRFTGTNFRFLCYRTPKIKDPVPCAVKQGPEHWDKIKEEVATAVTARYMAHTANITLDKILFSPLDIKHKNAGMWRGSVYGFNNRPGNFAPYRLPISGLYQTGDCTSPGGGISGFPGRNAAELILRDGSGSV